MSIEGMLPNHFLIYLSLKLLNSYMLFTYSPVDIHTISQLIYIPIYYVQTYISVDKYFYANKVDMESEHEQIS